MSSTGLKEIGPAGLVLLPGRDPWPVLPLQGGKLKLISERESEEWS